MSSISTPPSLISIDSWTKPEEQIERLILRVVKDQTSKHSGKIDPISYQHFLDLASKTATQFALKNLSSNKAEEDSETEVKVPSLFNMTVERLTTPNPLPSSVTNWYTSLERINLLPKQIPPLPWNIQQILDSKCPIRELDRKSDGTHYKIAETHSLYLIPPCSLNELAENANAYGKKLLSNENPLQFKYFHPKARAEHGDTRIEKPFWVLISNEVLPGSRGKTYDSQVEQVKDLNRKSFLNYEAPSLIAAAASYFLHKIATGESLYPIGDKKAGKCHTYTRVQERSRGKQLIVGGATHSGIGISTICGNDAQDIGITPVRLLPTQ